MSDPDRHYGDPSDRRDPSAPPASLASFLSEISKPRSGEDDACPCPQCGLDVAMMRSQLRLGCPFCYTHFRQELLPILARFHRHPSHLGKVPPQAGASANRHGEMTRLRVDLEKAIRHENYEEAARLRDNIRGLEALREET